jgi:hypothetical protein
MISIKGHEYHSAQSSYQLHDLTYQSFCKTHVSHGNNVLSSIAETNSRGLDAFIGHNISPCLRKQLVLELERREEGTELVNGLPSSISFRQRLPLYQHMPNPAAELGT